MKNYLSISICCIFSFVMGCYFFGQVYWYKWDTVSKLSSRISVIETGKVNNIKWSVWITTTTIVTEPIIIVKAAIDWGIQWENKQSEVTNQGWVELVLVQWFPEDSMATNIATYAYEVSNGDMDFLMTLKAENGWFDMYKQSNVPDKYWPNGREDSRWICQLHRKRHSDIVDDERFFTDYRFQVEECWKKYKGGTKFYWYYVRLKYKTHFTII